MIDIIVRHDGNADQRFIDTITLFLVEHVPRLLSTDRRPIVGQDIDVSVGHDQTRRPNDRAEIAISIIVPWSFNLHARRKTLTGSLQSDLRLKLYMHEAGEVWRDVECTLHLSRPTVSRSVKVLTKAVVA